MDDTYISNTSLTAPIYLNNLPGEEVKRKEGAHYFSERFYEGSILNHRTIPEEEVEEETDVGMHDEEAEMRGIRDSDGRFYALKTNGIYFIE